MSRSSARLLYWSPRILAIAFAAFLSLFALDAFGQNQGFWFTALAFLAELIPAAVIVGMLALAWRWEWIGAGLFTFAAALYAVSVLPQHWDWAVVISLPLLLIAALFLANWLERPKLQAAL